MKFNCLTTTSADPFMITWDLGRRCNYDCTYCAPIHHDNFSKHATLDSLKNTVNFIFEYVNLISTYRNNKDFHISLTGGEPTVNPKFLQLIEHLFNSKSAVDANLHLSLTTNGAMSKRIADAVGNTFNYVTISYHAEANTKLKKRVLERIEQLHKSTAVKVNVMFHAQHFDECVRVCDILKDKGIQYIPRMIGENPAGETYGHQYTAEQLNWFNAYWNVGSTDSAGVGAEIGRPCCGGRSMQISNGSNTQEVKFLTYRKFKDWHCSVNWYFLHIEQQTDSVYHHQTCQAKFDGTTGPIGTISSSIDIINTLKDNLTNNTMPIIVCPNTFCACGLCAPKSTDRKQLISTLSTIVDTGVFNAN
jgi:MoaA/NifB/PqqE/SkfB family radical SAM enzyme